MKTSNNVKYIVFADDWGGHPSSCQHIFQEIIKTEKVLWVNTVMRIPRINMRDLNKIWRKFFAKNKCTVSKQNNIDVVRPFMFPIFNKFFRALNKRLLLWQLHRRVNNETILVTTLPIVADIVELSTKVVYYCVDEFAEWPGHNKKKMMQLEKKLLQLCNIVVTTSTTLYTSKKNFHNNVHLLSHGVDIEHFRQKQTAVLKPPVIGYFGLFDERIDLALIENLLNKMPNYTFVVVGNVVIDINNLKKYPHLKFCGYIPYNDLPQHIQNFNICIIPYKINEQTKYINPLKLKEYLATEIPIVTTSLPALESFQHIIGWAQTPDEFLSKIDFFLQQETEVMKRKRLQASQQVLQNESWQEKTRIFKEMIHNQLNPK